MNSVLCLIDGLSAGGAQRQLVGLACLLKERAYSVSFMWYHPTSFYKIQLDEYGIKCFNPLPKNRLSKFLNIYHTIRAIRPDIVIAYLDGPAIIACLLKLLGMKYRLIVSERNTTQKINLHEKIKFWFYRYADYVVPNSYSQEQFINDNFIRIKRKTITITNFVDTNYYVPLSNKRQNRTLKVLVVGRVNTQKNVLRFLEVASILMERKINIHIDWYGDHSFNQEYWKEVISLYDRYGLSGYLDFHNPEPDILSKYQECDVFCLPSLYEGYPNVICEAMSCGLPVICSDVCDNSRIIADGKNGYLFDPLNTDSMVDAVIKISSLSNEEIRGLGVYSRKLAVEMFGKQKFINSYIKLMERS